MSTFLDGMARMPMEISGMIWNDHGIDTFTICRIFRLSDHWATDYPTVIDHLKAQYDPNPFTIDCSGPTKMIWRNTWMLNTLSSDARMRAKLRTIFLTGMENFPTSGALQRSQPVASLIADRNAITTVCTQLQDQYELVKSNFEQPIRFAFSLGQAIRRFENLTAFKTSEDTKSKVWSEETVLSSALADLTTLILIQVPQLEDIDVHLVMLPRTPDDYQTICPTGFVGTSRLRDVCALVAPARDVPDDLEYLFVADLATYGTPLKWIKRSIEQSSSTIRHLDIYAPCRRAKFENAHYVYAVQMPVLIIPMVEDPTAYTSLQSLVITGMDMDLIDVQTLYLIPHISRICLQRLDLVISRTEVRDTPHFRRLGARMFVQTFKTLLDNLNRGAVVVASDIRVMIVVSGKHEVDLDTVFPVDIGPWIPAGTGNALSLVTSVQDPCIDYEEIQNQGHLPTHALQKLSDERWRMGGVAFYYNQLYLESGRCACLKQ